MGGYEEIENSDFMIDGGYVMKNDCGFTKGNNWLLYTRIFWMKIKAH